MRLLLLLLVTALAFAACSKNQTPPRILVFSKTEGYRHSSIPAGIAALRQLCRDNQIMMDTTEDAGDFNERNLRQYAAVVFLNTTGDVLNPVQEAEFERYIQAGGGYVGIHSATDTEYGWKWYGRLAGAYFNGHPAIQEAKIAVRNHEHPATRHLNDASWMRRDEWYNFKEFNPAVQVLLSIDESSYEGGTMCQHGEADPCHPLAWCHEYDGGRAFYTAGGHTEESYTEPAFLQHLLGGIRYAIGKQKRLDYTQCTTRENPDPTRFVKTVLASDLTEPMEFEMLPDGRILFIERRGAIKILNPATGLITIVTKLPVHSEEEDGLLGLALDPQYETNRWIYLYYSPVGNKAVNNLSRFVFAGDTLDRASERLLLTVDVQREECCHAAGCIEFDAEGNLYLSTGDNTNPFASEGFSPSDERPGRSAWDAQRSSGNTMDLRGKILRIRPLPDGSYVCPEGNLFANGGEALGRPEIYVMGCRNPFRISLDKRRKLLFWGEVGPDAGEPDTARGPQGHDEVNRARAAGFFGWPYFVGNNKPYRDHDFATGKNGPLFDPQHPVNNSPNNTGARELPPAQPALIWYPYGNSTEFPLLGNGGRNAMAGPVFYADEYPSDTRLPDYYDGKLITYDWMRGWMMAVTLDSSGNFRRMEPFADSIKLSRPMDMFIDKNGSLWVLEYGTQWFSSNPDARISRIDYVRGNRPPRPQLAVDKTAGAAPLTVVFSAAKTRDFDNDHLQYTLDFGDETEPFHWEGRIVSQAGLTKKKKEKHNPLDSIAHTYATPGTYEVVLRVRDPRGAFSTVKQKISVGNEPPEVVWDFGGKNRSFYQPGTLLDYRLLVSDREDGSLASGGIVSASVATSIDYLETGFDITAIAQGHQQAKQATEYSRGKLLIERSDCRTCHAEDRQINGPSFQAVAERYRKDDFAVRNLSKKVIQGGAGNWGQVVMSAHPQVSEEDAGEMVRWILSLGGPAKVKQSLPVSGQYALTIPPPAKGKKPSPGTFIFQASYRDRGSSSQAALENGETLALRPAFFQAESADSVSKGVTRYRPFSGDTVVLNDLKHNSFFVIKRADLGGLHAVSVGVATGDKRYEFGGGRLELRLDGPGGPLAGTVPLPGGKTGESLSVIEVQMPLTRPADGRFHDLYFVLKNENFPSRTVGAVDWVRFEMLD
ncbi:MAG: ThuA domain-containing protein [Saprospiraceae bacterium]|nr:ThuA domain-containing protein [Saprospiraceae bacterium]